MSAGFPAPLQDTIQDAKTMVTSKHKDISAKVEDTKLKVTAKHKEYNLVLDGFFGVLAIFDIITDAQATHAFFFPSSGAAHLWWGSLSLGVLYLTMRLFFVRLRFPTNTVPALAKAYVPLASQFRNNYSYPLANNSEKRLFKWERPLFRDVYSPFRFRVKFVLSDFLAADTVKFVLDAVFRGAFGLIYLEVLGPIIGIFAFVWEQLLRMNSALQFMRKNRGKIGPDTGDNNSSREDMQAGLQATIIALSEGMFESLPQLLIQSNAYFRGHFLPASTFYQSFATSVLGIGYAVYSYRSKYADVKLQEQRSATQVIGFAGLIGAGDKAALVAVLNNGLDDSGQPTEHFTLASKSIGSEGAKLLAQVLLEW
jgi:hypothetical protein